MSNATTTIHADNDADRPKKFMQGLLYDAFAQPLLFGVAGGLIVLLTLLPGCRLALGLLLAAGLVICDRALRFFPYQPLSQWPQARKDQYRKLLRP